MCFDKSGFKKLQDNLANKFLYSRVYKLHACMRGDSIKKLEKYVINKKIAENKTASYTL